MNRYFKILTILIIASLFGLYHCAGGIDLDLLMQEEEEEVVEEVVSPVLLLEDSAGVTLLTTGSEGVDLSSLNIAFVEPVDICDGCIALTCDDLPFGLDQPTITVEQTDEEGKEYEISVEDAYLYQLKVCTLTISEDVFGPTAPLNVAASASKAAILREDVSFTFECGCAVSDEFNADSHSCWTVVDTLLGGFAEEATWWTWDQIDAAEVITFNENAGVLIYDDTNYEDNAIYDVTNNYRKLSFGKTVEISEQGFDMTIHFQSASNLSGGEAVQDFVGVGIYGTPANFSYAIGIGTLYDNKQHCLAMWMDFIVRDDPSLYVAGTECGSGEHYIRLTYTPTPEEVTPEYSTDGESWSTLELLYTEGPESMPIIENLSGIGQFGMAFSATAVEDTADYPRDNRAIIDSVITTGLSGIGGQ